MNIRTLRNSLLVMACVLISSAASSAQWPAIPFMDDMRVTIVGENLKYNGTWMNVYEIASAQDLEQVIEFYEHEWQGKVSRVSLPALKMLPLQQTEQSGRPDEESEPWTVLTRREDDFLITVQAGPDPVRTGTVGYVGVTQAFNHGGGPYKSEFPMLRGSQLISEIFANDLGKRSQTVTFFNRSSAEHNLNFYRNYYGRRGWHELGADVGIPPVGNEGGALLMSKGSSEFNLSVAKGGRRSLVRVVLVEK